MAMNEPTQGRFNATQWIIDVRWYYVPLAFFLGLVVVESNAYPRAFDGVLFGCLLVMLLSNFCFYLLLNRLRGAEDTGVRLRLMNAVQIATDLVFFFVVMVMTGGGAESIAHVFFFVPIVVSVILFGFHGALLVAMCSGALVLVSTLIRQGVWVMQFFPDILASPVDAPAVALTKVGIIALIYLLTGFFGGYITRIITARDLLLMEQIKREEGEIAKLEKLNIAFDASAKLLVRRDLELFNANQKLTKLDQMKSEIISVVAHQLRTPLSAIKWTLKMLLDGDVGKLPTEQYSLLSKGYESNERMIGLINDLLSVDRLESGKFKYTFIPVQFEELIRAMVSDLLPVATQRNVRVDLNVPPKPLPKIKVDPDKIHDVLQNLIDNAIKYSKENSVVTVNIVAEGALFHFSVTDQGIGIPEDQKDKIFARFFRATNAVQTQTNGSGLGLFIAQAIVKRHGGNIWFESKEGEGTTFHVTLPLVQ
jgi:signal transduction histidine kinase